MDFKVPLFFLDTLWIYIVELSVNELTVRKAARELVINSDKRSYRYAFFYIYHEVYKNYNTLSFGVIDMISKADKRLLVSMSSLYSEKIYYDLNSVI